MTRAVLLPDGRCRLTRWHVARPARMVWPYLFAVALPWFLGLIQGL